ncbi:MAG: ion channel [Pseudomonadota bacterium]
MTESIPFSEELIISAGMIGATVFFHAIIISAMAAIFRATKSRVWGPMRFVRDSAMLTILSLILMAAHGMEIWGWAEMLIRLEAFASFEEALYFSSVAYTTLGFGDVLLPFEWRLLSGAISADGLLLFGLSAAFLLETAARLRLGGERAN